MVLVLTRRHLFNMHPQLIVFQSIQLRTVCVLNFSLTLLRRKINFPDQLLGLLPLELQALTNVLGESCLCIRFSFLPTILAGFLANFLFSFPKDHYELLVFCLRAVTICQGKVHTLIYSLHSDLAIPEKKMQLYRNSAQFFYFSSPQDLGPRILDCSQEQCSLHSVWLWLLQLQCLSTARSLNLPGSRTS